MIDTTTTSTIFVTSFFGALFAGWLTVARQGCQKVSAENEGNVA